MKKILICMFVLMMGAMSCSSDRTNLEKTGKDPVLFIASFYEDFVFGREEVTDSVASLYFTPRLAERLRKEYDYDGEGYAIWKFRTGINGGEDFYCILSIDQTSGNTFTIEYNDAGLEGRTFLTLLNDDGRLVFDKVTYDESLNQETQE